MQFRFSAFIVALWALCGACGAEVKSPLQAASVPNTHAPDEQLECSPPEGTVTSASYLQVDTKPAGAWTNLAPWAFWSIDATRPRVMVELGSFAGYSYFAFCQAVQHFGLDTKAFAVDTWEGDDHGGYYDDSVFQSVDKCNRQKYAGFSKLVRKRFDEALAQFPDGSIDLLHIDGQHYYEDIKHDFESWLPKLSDRGVVLMHDVDVTTGSFGVYRYFAELEALYPTFNFHQGPGLGIVAVGRNVPAAVHALVSADAEQKACVEKIYQGLGDKALGHEAPINCD